MPTSPSSPKHIVVDGSNIATEGRTHPSLRQLDEAVRAFLDEHPHDTLTVVVDATFGHRIDASEVPAFDAAVENNELVTPPAGAIGRGDAFVLTIANKADAAVLSNDSFQEFHADYAWLFDEGRLIGGKPVPHVGWVFVARTPVRGPVSRRAIRESKKGKAAANHRPSKAASSPMPVPKGPPPGRRGNDKTDAAAPTGRGNRAEATKAAPAAHVAQAAPSSAAPARNAPINDLIPFLEFVETAPVGTSVEGAVESFSSHGAYVLVNGVRCYVPLRFLAEPAPKSAREVLSIGEQKGFVVVSFNPARRGVDIALPEMVPAGIDVLPAVVPGDAPAKRSTAKRAAKSAKAAKPARPGKPAAAEAPNQGDAPAEPVAKPAKPAKAAAPAKPAKGAAKAAKSPDTAKPAPSATKTAKAGKAAEPAGGAPAPKKAAAKTPAPKATPAKAPQKKLLVKKAPAAAAAVPPAPAPAPVKKAAKAAKAPKKAAPAKKAAVAAAAPAPAPAAAPAAATKKRSAKKAASTS